MTKKKWQEKIIQQCENIGTYKAAFDPTIEMLAEMLAQRDKIFREFKKDGSRAVISYTNKSGATNYVKNPLLTLWNDLNKTAIGYWRDLGLTPASLKRIDEKSVQPKKESNPMAELLEALENIE